MERIKGRIFKDFKEGMKCYLADNLSDYIKNFSTVSNGRNGHTCLVYGKYNIFSHISIEDIIKIYNFVNETKFDNETKIPAFLHDVKIENPFSGDSLKAKLNLLYLSYGALNPSDLHKRINNPIYLPQINYGRNSDQLYLVDWLDVQYFGKKGDLIKEKFGTYLPVRI